MNSINYCDIQSLLTCCVVSHVLQVLERSVSGSMSVESLTDVRYVSVR